MFKDSMKSGNPSALKGVVSKPYIINMALTPAM